MFLSKSLIKGFLSFFAGLFFLLGLISCEKNSEGDVVTLKLTSWRTDDVDKMNRINAIFTKAHPNIKIEFIPVNSTEYDDITLRTLEIGIGSDIMFLRSYDKGRILYDRGYLYDLTNVIPNLSSYSPVSLKAWSTENNITYGVPSVGVTHGIFYNKAILEKYNISEPETWADFISACETLYNGGEMVLAQGTFDTWTLYEDVFSGIGANFYGGEAERQALMSGSKKITDPSFIEAFKAVLSLKKYLPVNYETLNYPQMQQLFGTGIAAFFIGGSWEISVFEELGANSSKIGWFAPPVINSGDKLQYCFHVDGGIGVNKKSGHIKEALEYIKWVSGAEYAKAIMNEIPGFFSYTPETVTLTNPLAQKMFDAAANADLTVRPMCEKLSAQSPAGNTLMGIALNGLMNGTYTPETAAAFVQDGLDTWFHPAR